MSIAPPGPAWVPGAIPCPRCTATVGPEQEWCLECGAPARTRLVPTPNWRAPVAVLAVVVLLAGVALALAFVSLTNDTEPAAPVNSQAPPPSATGGQPQAPATPTTTPTATPGGGTTGAPPQGSSTGQSTGESTATGQSTSTGKSDTGTTTGQNTSTGKSDTGTTTGQSTSTGTTGATTTTGPG